MPTNFSATLGISLEQLALEEISVSLSPLVLLQVIVAEDTSTLSPPAYLAVDAVPIDTLSCPFSDVIRFITSAAFTNFSTHIGDLTVMPDIIQISDSSSINVSTMVLSNKAGTGDMVMTPPSGCSYQIKGARFGLENLTANYTIPQHKSGYVWTNVSATGTITASLPSGASIGTTALFIRTGPSIVISTFPGNRIWLSASGFFKPSGQAATLASSGAKMGLICDGSNGWYPTIEEGTIS